MTLTSSVVLPDPLQPARPMMRMTTYMSSFGRRFHAQGANALARCRMAQDFQKRPDGRTVAPVRNQQEIVILRRDGQERKPIHARHRLNSHTPVGAALSDRGGNCVVRARLVGITSGTRAAQQIIEQCPRAGTGVAVD